MKILFVTDLYPINNEEIAKALFYFVQEWQKQGHEVEVIRANFVLNTLIRGRKIKKQNIYYENGTKIYNLNYYTPFWFNVKRKLPKDFSIKNYDVVISHMPCGALMANKLLKKNKIKYICAVHASDIVVLKSIKYFLFRKKLKQAYLNADKIAARSATLQQKIEEVLPEVQDKTFVAYSGIDDKLIETELQPKKFNQEILKISTAASLIKRKNIDIIIKALALIPYKFEFTIIGDGNQRKYLEHLVKKYRLYGKIFFTGKIERSKVINELRKSDIFILVSDNETYGISYLEAMVTGNIVIAKKNDGIDGILQNGQNAFLINPDKYELKQCLEKIYSMKEKDLEIIKEHSSETIKNLSASKSAESYIENIMN